MLLAVIIAIVVRRKKAQQKIYEVPVEPTPPNLENPMYGEWLREGVPCIERCTVTCILACHSFYSANSREVIFGDYLMDTCVLMNPYIVVGWRRVLMQFILTAAPSIIN